MIIGDDAAVNKLTADRDMAEETSNTAAKKKKFFNRFSTSQKVFIGSVVLLIIVVIIIILAATSTYGVLYSNLSARDSGLIIERLKDRKVPYRLSAGGSVIKVPDDRVAELRIELAAAGLPESGGVGFEIFDKTSLSASDFVQNIDYIGSVERELARTLSQLKEVISAKVHITLPNRSVSSDEQEEAKASIVLNLRPGARVNETIVPAVLHLTAQSVAGLKPGNIAIADVYGNLLSRPVNGEEDVFAGLTTTQMDYQGKMEQSLAKKIIALLEPHVGAGKVRADVKLKMNFVKMETTEEKVDPDNLAKVSEKSESSSTAPSKSKSEKSLINYEVSKKITHLTKPMGEIERISAAVVIDDALVDVREQGGELVKQSRRRTSEELEAIKKIVQAAVGFDSQRGDVIEVANLPFDTSAEKVSKIYQEIYKPTTADRIEKFFSTPLGIAVLIFLIMLIIFLFRKRLLRGITGLIREARLPKPREVEIPQVDGEKLLAIREAKDEADIERELREKYKVSRSAKKMTIIRDKVKRFASENKDETATLVKSFLYED
jgi:flagellar M-ring protein FliF